MICTKVLSVAALAMAACVGLASAGLLGGGYPRGPAPAFGGGYGGYSGGYGGAFASGPATPYNFQYAVRDAFSGSDFGQHEGGDGAGNVKGEYQVLLPDGRRQTVSYSASDATGYVANVHYSGTPHYPSGPSGGYRGGAGAFGGGYGGGAGGHFGGGLASTYLPPHGK